MAVLLGLRPRLRRHVTAAAAAARAVAPFCSSSSAAAAASCLPRFPGARGGRGDAPTGVTHRFSSFYASGRGEALRYGSGIMALHIVINIIIIIIIPLC